MNERSLGEISLATGIVGLLRSEGVYKDSLYCRPHAKIENNASASTVTNASEPRQIIPSRFRKVISAFVRLILLCIWPSNIAVSAGLINIVWGAGLYWSNGPTLSAASLLGEVAHHDVLITWQLFKVLRDAYEPNRARALAAGRARRALEVVDALG